MKLARVAASLVSICSSTSAAATGPEPLEVWIFGSNGKIGNAISGCNPLH
jgi:hypothetical protein